MARWERHAPLTGVLAVVLWIVGSILTGETKDKPTEILAQVQDDTGKLIIGAIIFLIGTGFFVWFLGSLRARLLTAEGGTQRLTALAYGSGIGTAVFLMGIVTPIAAAAINEDDLNPSIAAAMVNMSDAFFLGAEYMAPVMLIAFALVAIRFGGFPKWLAWLSILIAIGMLTGWVGWIFLIFGLPLWTLIVSVLSWMRGEPAALSPPAV